MLFVGSGTAYITPPVGLPLSGFAVRQNKPSIAIDAPLLVKSIVFQTGEEKVLLLSYDLLGFDQPLDQSIRDAISSHFGENCFKIPLLITTTHTHSTPPTMPIAGETRVPPTYIDRILQATVTSISIALDDLSEVELFYGSTELTGINLNRRQPQFPQESPEWFPYDPTLDLWVFKSIGGPYKASLVRFSCHAVTRCDMRVSADFPGELTRRLETSLGGACVFLEGTAGDINPTVSGADQAGVNAFVDRIWAQIGHLPVGLSSEPVGRITLKTRQFTLPFAPFPQKKVVVERITQNKRILDGDTTSPDLQPMIAGYASWRFPDDLDIVGTVNHWAEVDIEAAELTIKAIDHPENFPGATLTLAALTMGRFTLIFLSGEVMTTLGQQVNVLNPGKPVKIISYLSPIVGYIGTQEDYRIGGYEPDSSSMWYRQPGPFRADIDQVVLNQVQSLLGDLPQTNLTSIGVD